VSFNYRKFCLGGSGTHYDTTTFRRFFVRRQIVCFLKKITEIGRNYKEAIAGAVEGRLTIMVPKFPYNLRASIILINPEAFHKNKCLFDSIRIISFGTDHGRYIVISGITTVITVSTATFSI
jgi:hypothetical protein